MPRLRNRAARPVLYRLSSPVESLESRLLLATQYFNNFQAMNVFDGFGAPPTPAERFPGFFDVSGVTGTITELRVTLYAVYHTRPQDLDILLESPAGKSVLIMSDAGGSVAVSGDNAVNLVFSDDATRSLPQSSGLTPGLFRPTDYDPVSDTLADVMPDGAPFESTDTTLAALAADNPTGTWKLYVADDQAGHQGGVGLGWGLTFVTNGPGPAAPSVPDMHPASDRGMSNSDNITNDNTPLIRGTGAAGTQVRLFVDGVPDATIAVSGTGTYQVAIEAALTDGVHVISARALDANGTEGPATSELTVTIDTVFPDAPTTPDLTPESDTGPSNTDNDTTDSTPTFTGSAPGADIVTLLANDNEIGSGAVTSGAYTVTAAEPLAPGTYQIMAIASDIAGNSVTNFKTLQVIIRPGGTTPRITDAYARGSAWAPPSPNAVTFMEYLEAQALGDDEWGYRLATGATLPWVNVNQIVLRYDGALTAPPAAAGIVVDGVNSDYTVTSTLLNSQTVLLALNRTLGNLPAGGENGDRIRLTVPGGGAGGAAYTLNFNVLQGDVNRNGSVLANDYSEVKSRFFQNTSSPNYTAFHDADGSGSILANDYSAVKARFFDALPPAAASAGAFSANRITDDVLA